MLPQEPHVLLGTFLVAFDLLGTFVFALSGATAGIKHRLDLFGVLVLSFAAANAGGITRDLLIGATPPPGISDWRYITIATCSGLLAFSWQGIGEQVRRTVPVLDWRRIGVRLNRLVLLFDAAGLALYAITGALKALAYHLGPVPAVILGVMTGVGGGVLRDILVREVPAVLRSELYAVAALAGATVVVTGKMLGLPTAVVAPVGALLCFALRFMAIRRGWRLPVAR